MAANFSCSNVSILTYIFISLFAMASWININGAWVELPLLVNSFPEGWNLPSYMSLIIQLSNIAPVLYSLFLKFCCKQRSHFRTDIIFCSIIIIVGLCSSFMMSFFWNYSGNIGGTEYSVSFLTLLSIASLMSCLSSMVFLPYMARYSTSYLSAYYIGQGLSGLIPGMLGLVQGLGSEPTCVNTTIDYRKNNSLNLICNSAACSSQLLKLKRRNEMLLLSKDNFLKNQINCSSASNDNCTTEESMNSLFDFISYPVYAEPRFSIPIFYILITILLLISLSAFYLLNFTRLKKNQNILNAKNPTTPVQNHDYGAGEETTRIVDNQNLTLSTDDDPSSTITPSNSMDNKYINSMMEDNSREQQRNDNRNNSEEGRNDSEEDRINAGPEKSVSNSNNRIKRGLSNWVLVLYLLIVAIINSATNGLLPSTQSYTCLPFSNTVYTLSIRLSSIISPLAALLTMFVPRPNYKWIVALFSLSLSVVIFHLVLAFQSPHPVLQGTLVGSILVVASTLVMVAIFSFIRVSITAALHEHGGRKALIWCGAIIQLGSFCGAMLAFGLINWTHLFVSITPCK